MRLTDDDARERFAGCRSARLATTRPDGSPHLVPIVFALDGDRLYFAVDAKPKTTTALQRLANIAAEPRVSVLADVYDEAWTQLWWARADGTATVADRDEHALDLLAQRYAQYREQRPTGPVVTVRITRWTGWAASGQQPSSS